MGKIRTPDECSALVARQKEYEKSQRSDQFNKSVTEVVELVCGAFVGKTCVVPLKIGYRVYNMDGDPGIRLFVERDKKVIKAAVELLREEFQAAGWDFSIYAKTPI